MSVGRMTEFFERLWYRPRAGESLLGTLLLPASLLYGGAMYLRRRLASRRRYPVPVVSIGNLVLGGTGKTPFVIELASRYPDTWIVSRGYGRKSRGAVEVSERGRILCSVEAAGDEAMLMARRLSKAGVIVSEDRHLGIAMALEKGAKLIVLDDGFNRVEIDKFEILLEPERLPNRRILPAGPFREFPSTAVHADLLLREGRDFRRIVRYENLRSRMLLATSIARPERLDAWLPEGIVGRYRLPDHAWFDETELYREMERCGAEALLVTEKDRVKLEGFKLPISEMRLELSITPAVFQAVEAYIKEYDAT